MLFQKRNLSKLLSIVCAVLILALFVLQFFPYWSFEEKTIHVYSDAHDDEDFKGFSVPIVSDVEQPNREAFTLAETHDSINALVWFPVKHKDTRMHLHLEMGDPLKSQNGQKLVIGRGQSIPRSTFVSFIIAAFNITSPEGSGTDNFEDLKEGETYVNNVLIARNTGILDVPEDNKFRPNEPITRSEAMLILYRVLNYETVDKGDLDFTAKVETPIESYSDYQDIPEETLEAVSALMNAGIIPPITNTDKETNTEAQLIAPNEKMAASVITKFFEEYFPERYGKLGGGSLVSPHEVAPLDNDDNFEANSLALAIVIQQLFGLVMLILLASKPNTIFPSILAFFHGVWGILGGFVFCPALKLGDMFMVHTSISAAVLVVSIVAIIVHIFSKKQSKSKV